MAPIRFSLKWLMASVAIAALSAAALANASEAWATAVISAIGLGLLAAALIAAVGAGSSRAFAVGFLLGACSYLLLWQATMNGWFMLSHTDLVTNRVVDRIYFLIRKESPPANPGFGGVTGGVMMPGAVGFFSGKPLGPAFVPDAIEFRKIAHWLIACCLGAASGRIARRLQAPRSNP